MRMHHRTKRMLLLIGAALVALIAWTVLRPGGFEVAVLRTFSNGNDAYTSVWVLDDEENGFVWLRAHRGDRRWLARLREDPQVGLRRRGGRSLRYVARVFDDDASRAYVSTGFREKYGLMEWAREWTQDSEVIPVRLRSR